jgi:acyl carrier protein
MQAVNSNSKLNQESIQNWLVEQLADVLSLSADSIDVTEPLTRYGLDSIDAVTLVGDLEDWLDLELPDTLFWDHSTIAQAAQFLVDNYDLEEIEAEVEETKTQELETVGAGEKKSFWGRLTGK